MYVLHSFRYICAFIPVTDLWAGEGVGGGTEGGRSTCPRPQQPSPPPVPTPTAKTRPKYGIITPHHIVLFAFCWLCVAIYMTCVYLLQKLKPLHWMSPSLPVQTHHPPIRQVARNFIMILEKKIDFFRHSRLKNFISDMHLNTCVCLTDVLIIDSHYKSCVSLCTENGLEDDSSSVDSFRGAVPQTSLLDTSANRDKGQLVSAANRNRRPPTKRNIKVIRQIYLPGPLTK